MSLLDKLFGKHLLQNNGTPLTERSVLNFLSGVTFTDDPTNDAVKLAIVGGGGGVGGTITHVTFTDSPYRILATDQQIGVDASAGDVVVQMPDDATEGMGFVVFDELGSVPGHSITIESTDDDTFDGQASWAIPAAYGAVELLFTGSHRWHVR